MSAYVTGIDHGVIAVRDLDAAAAAFERLGFTLTPKGHHVEWGTANRCIMFGDSYLQLIGAGHGAETADRYGRALAGKGEGLMALAFATPDGAAAYDSFARAGLNPEMPRSLHRDFDGATALFSIVALPPEATPGLSAYLCQHLTPEVLRRPQWLRHANGANGIAAVTAVVDQPESLAPAYERLFGPGTATPTDNTIAVHTGRGLIFLCEPDELTQLHPDADLDPPPTAPALVALTLTIADPAAALVHLRAHKVAFSVDAEDTIRIPPEEAAGVYLELMRG